MARMAASPTVQWTLREEWTHDCQESVCPLGQWLSTGMLLWTLQHCALQCLQLSQTASSILFFRCWNLVLLPISPHTSFHGIDIMIVGIDWGDIGLKDSWSLKIVFLVDGHCQTWPPSTHDVIHSWTALDQPSTTWRCAIARDVWWRTSGLSAVCAFHSICLWSQCMVVFSVLCTSLVATTCWASVALKRNLVVQSPHWISCRQGSRPGAPPANQLSKNLEIFTSCLPCGHFPILTCNMSEYAGFDLVHCVISNLAGKRFHLNLLKFLSYLFWSFLQCTPVFQHCAGTDVALFLCWHHIM